MNPRFPLPDVKTKQVPTTRTVAAPLYADNFWQLNQTEFAMQVEGVGSFYACNGAEVEYSPLPSATPESVELYLNGSVYGAILHQRKILPLHGSSFVEQGMGVMLCGESGSGKSALTTAFCLNGAQFLTDDVTPVVFNDRKPFILALSDRIKLWDNTFEQLNLEKSGLKRIDPETEKYYFNMISEHKDPFPLDLILVLKTSDSDKTEFIEIPGADKFMSVRNEIYRKEFLEGMPDNEIIFFKNIADIANNAKVFNVFRPSVIPVLSLMEEVREKISGIRA